MTVGKSRVGITCFLVGGYVSGVVKVSEKEDCSGISKLLTQMYRNNGQGLLKAKVNLFIGPGMTTHHQITL